MSISRVFLLSLLKHRQTSNYCLKNFKYRLRPRNLSSPLCYSHAFLSENLRSRFDNDCRTIPHVKCWNCDYTLECERDKFFCRKCSRIQPPVKCVNYFQYLGLPVVYDIDPDLLTESFKKLQARLHPDRFSNKSQLLKHSDIARAVNSVKLKKSQRPQRSISHPEQKHSALQASIINKAYKTLLEPLSRALYLLELYDFSFDEKIISVDDVELLNEVMQLNESIMDAHAEQVEKIAEKVRRILHQLQKDFSVQFKQAVEKGDFNESFRTASKMKYYVAALKNADKKLGFL
uniref:J domain-containing protein n=1 Tax=Romanomermis culicivorax TaxID=13658 RepID=A0A915IQ66_ROMCU